MGTGIRLRQLLVLAASAASILAGVAAQTWSKCDPTKTGGCPPNPALGRSFAVDLTKGPSDMFTAIGEPVYDQNGVSLTVAKPGDAPTLTSKFYIMFGKLDVTVKAAPGAGIVSSVVLQSDALDEIDWEWLGASPNEVQTNYFRKGQTAGYNRGAWHPDRNNQGSFKTYTIDWTADQILWQIDGTTVRALQPQQAAGQYPQTPMVVKVGAWSGGDPSNEQGTINWARGPTDFSKAPFTMQVKSMVVTDYSTGTQYKYNGQEGTWQSIEAVGGRVNSGGSGARVILADVPAPTSSASGMPVPFQGTYRTPTTVDLSPTAYPGLPSGWVVTSSGKVLPPSSAPTPNQASLLLLPPSASPAYGPQATAGAGAEYYTTTKWDDKGFPTVVLVNAANPAGATAAPRLYDDRGFPITAADGSRATSIKGAQAAQVTGNGGAVNGKVKGAATRLSVDAVMSKVLVVLASIILCAGLR